MNCFFCENEPVTKVSTEDHLYYLCNSCAAEIRIANDLNNATVLAIGPEKAAQLAMRHVRLTLERMEE